MAIFGSKKNKGEVKKGKKPAKVASVKKETESVVVPPSVNFGGKSILVAPRITEKASMLSEGFNVYTFNISKDATKKDVEKTINGLYNVRPVKVRVVKVPSKRTFVRGKRGVKSGGRKAYIYLKAGDKIEMA